MRVRPTQHILRDIALHEWKKLLRSLPRDVAARALDIQVICTSRPTHAQTADGIERDCLGLFVGSALDEPDGIENTYAPEMFLFLSNLWDFAGEEKPAFRDEVRLTFLHELGHYLGFEEDDLEQRGIG